MQSLDPTAPLTSTTAAAAGDPTDPGAAASPVTQLARLEALVEAQSMELEALRSARREMMQTAEYLRVLSHQMRTPLGTILAAIGLLEGGQQSAMSAEECNEYAGYVTSAVRRLDAIAESACVIGCLNGDRVPAQRHHGASASLRDGQEGEGEESLENVVAVAIQTARQKEMQAQQQQRQDSGYGAVGRIPEVRVQLPADAAQLMLTGRAAGVLDVCLTQLISNAMKFTSLSEHRQSDGGPGHGSGPGNGDSEQALDPVLASISFIPGSDECCIHIRDYGVGLPEDLGQHMYDPFRRGTNARGTVGEGMGLYIARRCAQLINGTLEIGNAHGANASAPALSHPQEQQQQQQPQQASGPGVLARLQFPISGCRAQPA